MKRLNYLKFILVVLFLVALIIFFLEFSGNTFIIGLTINNMDGFSYNFSFFPIIVILYGVSAALYFGERSKRIKSLNKTK